MKKRIDAIRSVFRLRARYSSSNSLPNLGPILSPAVRVSFHHRGAVLFHRKLGVIYMANATGARIIQALMNTFDSEALTQDLSHKYKISKQRAACDVSMFLEMLERSGCLAHQTVTVQC
jgi:hypothetical protein